MFRPSVLVVVCATLRLIRSTNAMEEPYYPGYEFQSQVWPLTLFLSVNIKCLFKERCLVSLGPMSPSVKLKSQPENCIESNHTCDLIRAQKLLNLTSTLLRNLMILSYQPTVGLVRPTTLLSHKELTMEKLVRHLCIMRNIQWEN